MRTKRALISVFDKSGIVDFAKSLNSMGWEIISTGGTSKKLKEEGLQVKDISDLTQFPECFDGRVKTLHPNVEGGILAIRDNEKHKQQMTELGIEPIDMVVCNLYPFKETILKAGVSHEEIIENIDIGGPTMIRAAAKNYPFVTVITDPKDYTKVIEEIQAHGDTSLETKELLAAKVFIHTAHYDALIANYFSKRLNIQSPKTLTLTFEKKQDLRYGENPHQSATFYTQIQETEGTLTGAVQLHGKEYRVASELFAQTADVYTVLDLITLDDYVCDTFDGESKSKKSCMKRIARVLCADLDSLSEADVVELARFTHQKQIEQIADALKQVSETQNLDLIVTTGLGKDILDKKAAEFLGLEVKSMDTILTDEECVVAPAVGTAVMMNRFLN